MQRLTVNIPFFLSFSIFASQKGLNNVYSIPSINVQTNLHKLWHLDDGTSLLSTHPPNAPVKLSIKDEVLIASPYKKGREGNGTESV